MDEFQNIPSDFLIQTLLERHGLQELNLLAMGVYKSRRSPYSQNSMFLAAFPNSILLGHDSPTSSRSNSAFSSHRISSSSFGSFSSANAIASSIPPQGLPAAPHSAYSNRLESVAPSPTSHTTTHRRAFTNPTEVSGMTQTNCEAEGMGDSVMPLNENLHTPKAVMFCMYCCEQGKNLRTFGLKSDWKKHLMKFHETGEEFPCPVGGCSQVFDRSKDFTQHSREFHANQSLPPEKVKVQLLPSVAFGCGFEGCVAVYYNWDSYCKHVAECMIFGRRWNYSTKIRNLLRQSAIPEVSQELFRDLCARRNTRRSHLRWYPINTRILRQKLECNDFRPGFKAFITTAFSLGLSTFPEPSLEPHDIPAYIPDGFVTPRSDSVANIHSLDSQQLRKVLMGAPEHPDKLSQCQLSGDALPTVARPDPFLQHSLPPHGAPLTQEFAFNISSDINQPGNRISYMDLGDDFADFSSFTMDQTASTSALNTHGEHQLSHLPTYSVSERRPFTPDQLQRFSSYVPNSTFQKPDNFIAAPTCSDPQRETPHSSKTSQETKSKKTKSGLSFKKSIGPQPGVVDHPDLPFGFRRPTANKKSTRSTMQNFPNSLDAQSPPCGSHDERGS